MPDFDEETREAKPATKDEHGYTPLQPFPKTPAGMPSAHGDHKQRPYYGAPKRPAGLVRDGEPGGASHRDPGAKQRPEDEHEVNWSAYVKPSAPADPYAPLDVVPRESLAPLPPNARVLYHENVRIHQRLPADDRLTVHPYELVNRQRWWDAYRTTVAPLETLQRSIAADVNRCRHAEADEELRALGFIMSDKQWKGTTGMLAQEQQLPKRGGLQVRSLFRADDSVNTNRDDERAIASAASALRHGQGHVERDLVQGTYQADRKVNEAVNDLKAAAFGVAAADAKLKAALDERSYEDAKHDKEEAEAEIARLKGEAQVALSVLSFLAAVPSKLATLAAPAVDGHGFGKIAAIGNLILSIVPDDRLTDAEEKLRTAAQRMKVARASRVQHEVEEATLNASAAVNTLKARRSALLASLTQRRKAYDQASSSAAQVTSGSASSKQKVAAIISAIPIVEAVVSRIDAVKLKLVPGAQQRSDDKGDATSGQSDASQQTTPQNPGLPAYSREAGLGFGLTLYHEPLLAAQLPRVIGELIYLRTDFWLRSEAWQKRLAGLVRVKEQITGPRPADGSSKLPEEDDA